MRWVLEDSYTEGLERYERVTTEHVVYFRSSDSRVVKCTKPGKFGLGHGPKGFYGRHPDATPLFYLQRISLMNQEFPTDFRLEGVALNQSQIGNRKIFKPYLITSQRYIERTNKDHPHPSEEEVGHLMTTLGFKLIEDSHYNWFRESDGIIVTDARQRNFIISHEGIVPIDLIISAQPHDSG